MAQKMKSLDQATILQVSSLSDDELAVLAYAKNKEAYGELSKRYYRKLFSYIFHLVSNKEETEDILQNVFSKTYKNIKNFDTSRKFSSWIYRIAHNESVNFLKRNNKHYAISWDNLVTNKDKINTAASEELPGEKLEHLEIIREVDEALKKLPERYRQILELRYFKEYSYEKIGELLKKPVNTVGTLINRAKKKLFTVIMQQGKMKK
jgi:RNA polymerase sigma-70 factor (ECF subfamily)